MTARWLAALTAAALLASPAAADDRRPPEPDGYRTGVMRAPTPATLAGARVLDRAALELLVAEGPVMIDVGPADVRPANLPEGSVWAPTHRSIPGATWLPGAGAGDMSPAREAELLARVAELTGGDLSEPIVVFCRPECWASWNLGKRLVEAGYTSVAWFPGGIDAWQEAHPTAPVEPMPGWEPEAVTPSG